MTMKNFYKYQSLFLFLVFIAICLLINLISITAYNSGFEARGKYEIYSTPIHQIINSTPIILPKIENITSKEQYEITSYCLSGIMANGQEVHNGAIACPAYMPLGTKVKIEWPGFINDQFICEDRMGLKYRNGKYIDVWVSDCDIAINFGRRNLLVEIID